MAFRARHRIEIALIAVAALAAGCAHGPPPPDWQAGARQAADRSAEAYLAGDERLERLEFDNAKADIARTGRIDLMARLELMRCAARVASLEFATCDGFEGLRAGAAPAERAYANYLAGHPDPQDADLLPALQRVAARALAGAPGAAAPSIRGGSDTPPLSSLVAAAVLLHAGRADPSTIADAIDIASERGWRRPLLAWLGVARMRAERAGDAAQADRLRARMDLVQPAPDSVSGGSGRR
jgi:hypothetical protein